MPILLNVLYFMENSRYDGEFDLMTPRIRVVSHGKAEWRDVVVKYDSLLTTSVEAGQWEDYDRGLYP